ncbi:MAG: type II toxin-antitoxin system VapC family toxin [Beijerinckiaceae bacterium]
MTGYLLDTHILIWMLMKPEKLSEEAQKAISSPSNNIFVSTVNIWEISVKYALGRQDAPPLDGLQALELAERAGCQTLQITPRHAIEVGQLPLLHNDPFDRMLIAQSRYEGLTLITRDTFNLSYPISTLRG